MSETPAKREADGTEKFLLAEYGSLSDSFWKNEESGEKRVNFLITLVTAVLAAIVALATKQGALSDNAITGIAFASCLALLAVGLVTFRRMIGRNEATDEYKDARDEIRDRFRRVDATGLLDGYDPFPRSGRTRRRLGGGGLADLVAVVNSVIVAAGVAALCARDSHPAVIAVSVVAAFAVSLFLHNDYVGRRPGRAKPTETESTLVVVSDEPEKVARDVAALTELDGFVLRHRRDQAIRDRYFDAEDGRLGARRTALRLREVGSSRVLSIKGPSQPGSRGGATRDEQEEKWPTRAWALLRKELGGELPIPDARPSDDPVAALRAIELDVVQDRETLRRVREVVPRAKRGSVAELAVDTVTFHLSGNDVRHYEIEVEVKGPGGDAAVAALTESLVISFWPSLRPWRHGKLSTGKAVATLIRERGQDGLLTEDGTLRPSAYDAIAALLEPPRGNR